MKVKDLIKQLQKLPQNKTVLIWDGWEGEYMKKIRVRTNNVERANYPKSQYLPKGYIGEWVEYAQYVDPQNIEQRNVVEIYTTDHVGKKASGRYS